MILGYTWRRKLPTTGELRDPVTMVQGRTLPDGFAGMDLTLTKVYDAWAKVELVNGVMKSGDSEVPQKEVTHSLIIRRHEAMQAPSADHLFVCRGRLLRVLDYRELDARAFYWVIACNDEGPLSSWTYDNPDTPENPNDPDNPQPEPTDVPFPFWS